VIGVVAFLTELYCVSRYIHATGSLNTILELINVRKDPLLIPRTKQKQKKL
jgi:predicted glycosyltransferase